jgi:hypothetical protein
VSPLLRWYRGRDDRVTRDERILARLPVALIDYRLELCLAAWGIVSGPPRLLGVRSGSLGDLLPEWGILLFAALMTLGAATVLWGLRRRRYGSTVARGMELLGTTYLCYGVSLFALWTVPAALLGVLMVFLTGLCWLSAWILVLRARSLRRADLAGRRTTLRFDGGLTKKAGALGDDPP